MSLLMSLYFVIMNKISAELRSIIEHNPETEHSVLIVIDPDSEIEGIEVKDLTQLMHNIYSANLTKEKIAELSTKSFVVSIESDQDMGAV